MGDEQTVGQLSALQVWAKLQEIAIQKRERLTWLEFYDQRLQCEKEKYEECIKCEKMLTIALEKIATPEELESLKGWSL